MLNLVPLLPERPPSETGLCSLEMVYLLEQLGVPRCLSLLLTPEQAYRTLATVCKDRQIDMLLFGESATPADETVTR